MSVVPALKGTTLDFGRTDLADRIDPPPVLFHAMRVPCACGRPLTDPIYTFFPSAVFAHGECPVCGPQTAIFAPHMKGLEEQMPAYLGRTLKLLVSDVARTFKQSPEQVLAEFMEFLVQTETMRLAAAASGTVTATA